MKKPAVVFDIIEIAPKDDDSGKRGKTKHDDKKLSKKDKEALILQLESDMKRAAKQLDFERAAILRDRIKYLREN